MSHVEELHSALVAPEGRWWNPIPRQEKVWISVAFGWCLLLFAMMPIWHVYGGQNPTGIRGKVDPKDFQARTMRFVADYQVGVENGIPVVEPPPGSHVYLLARMWSWYPILKLKQDTEYTLHLSSADINHGFNLYPMNLNFQVVPGYDYGLRIRPGEAGDLRVVCNEFCGILHHTMVGKIIVTE